MKKYLTIFLAAFLFWLPSCNDDANLDDKITGPLYGLKKGEPGSVDELIYGIWEKTGVYYLYDYSPNAFMVTNWSTYYDHKYTPVKSEDIEAVRAAVSKIQDNVFKGVDDDFIHRNWFVRIFLCDEFYDFYGDLEESNYIENSDYLIIPNVNASMLAYSDADWDKWIASFSDLLISRLYLGAPSEPTAFFDLRAKKANGTELTYLLTGEWTADPDDRYSKNVYTFRSLGYVRSKPNSFQTETINVVTRQMDVADYINFLTKTTVEEMDWCWSHFPKMKERAQALIPYLYDVLGLDLVKMQNANAPEDPASGDYFRNI